MSIRTAVAMTSLHFPAIRLPKWPKFNLFQRLPDTTPPYARAISTTYLTALGMDPDSSVTAERRRRSLDY
jgi:hypothetical protein